MARVDRGSVKWVTIYDDEHSFAPNYMLSLIPMLGFDRHYGNEALWRGGWLFQNTKSYDVADARNRAVATFLESHAEFLLFIDGDMGFEPDACHRLLAVCDPVERPIVGGLCFGYTPTKEGAMEANGSHRYPFPTIYDLDETEHDIGFRIRWWYRPNTVQKVGATGAAMLLVHRSAFERIAEKYGHGSWFDRIKHPKATSTWGEDVSFCVRAQLTGIPVHVDTSVRTSHLKPVYVSEAFFASQITAQPADEEIDVIVPVLGRPHHAEPFMRSLRATTGLARATVMVNHDADEDHDAWVAAGATVHRCAPGRTTFAAKVNDALRLTDRPWLLLVGSDVLFRPGWWDHALQTARAHGADVVATNDMGNLEVRDGLLATHPVMRRDYVLERGASMDGPGTIAHEGYRHWWVDAEWSLVALTRNTLATAHASHVEHLHPAFGKQEMDDTYELGQRYKTLDRELYERRAKRWQREMAA